MAQLLVSVRSVEEAAQALAGGAAVIDVKEPRLGSLGRADNDVIADVVRFVAGRRPVSAAVGELLDDAAPFSEPCVLANLSFVKCGLAGCGRVSDWTARLHRRQSLFTSPGSACQFVHVAYADWQCAQAPPLQDVVELACRTAGNILLLDTCCKTLSASGTAATLLDWLTMDETVAIGRRCQQAGVRLALAGSISTSQIGLLLQAQPTWFAVRGAACADGKRDGLILECRVRKLVRLLQD